MQARRPLYVVGAGDFGRELESMLEMIPAYQRDWDIAGYIDDDPKALDGLETAYKVAGSVDRFAFPKGSLAVVAIADPVSRQRVSAILEDRVTFLSYIHPTALVFKYVRIGSGAIIGANVVLSNSVTLGRFVILNQGVQIGHDSTIGDFAAIQSHTDLGGNCQLGDRVYIGLAATLVPGIKVGADAKIGAGSVVVRNVREKVTVFGNPAKVLVEPGSERPASGRVGGRE